MPEDNRQSDIKELGKFGLITHLADRFHCYRESTLSGIADDAGLIKDGTQCRLFHSALFIENIHFDLTYFPLKHLGYKVVAAAVSDIVAMNGLPTHITVNVAVSNRFTMDAVNELMEGMQRCCDRYEIDVVGLDISSSQTGLVISVAAMGEVDADRAVGRKGARENELICVSGDLGGAYTGLLLLEREKKIFSVNPDSQPDFDGFDYLLERQLKPEPRVDIIKALKKENILPSAMINVADGLASAVIHLCRASQCGSAVFENKLPIDALTFKTLKDLKIVATTIALNGGEDYEVLFTVAQNDYEKLKKISNVSVIGYIKEASAGNQLITNDDCQIELKAQGFGEVKSNV